MKKSNNLRGILSDLEPLNEEKQLKVKIDEKLESRLEKLFRVYEKYLRQNISQLFPPRYVDAAAPGYAATILGIIKVTPHTINEFVSRVVTYEDYENFERTGNFLALLVQQAYNKNYNNFTLNLTHLRSLNIQTRIAGTSNKPLKLTIVADLPPKCLRYIQHCDITIKGTVSWYAFQGVEDSTFVFESAGKYSGEGAQRCVFKSPSKESLSEIARRAKGNCKFIWLNGDTEVNLYQESQVMN